MDDRVINLMHWRDGWRMVGFGYHGMKMGNSLEGETAPWFGHTISHASFGRDRGKDGRVG